MNLEASLRQKLESAFNPVYLEIENESQKHSRGGNETHFRIIVVSEKFEGLSRVDRQRQVAGLFDEERAQGLHALSQRTFTPGEWESFREKLTLTSPNCHHKN